jgi:NADH-quinone oxidoreductase subunit A
MALPHLLADIPAPRHGWLPVVVLMVIALGFVVVTLLASVVIGPRRTGPGKEMTYESGMTPVGDARRRFNVRFYLMAMVFLVFDVEVVFFYPWATVFPQAVVGGTQELPAGLLLLVEMAIFVLILVIAYAYAWAKGVFRWD